MSLRALASIRATKLVKYVNNKMALQVLSWDFSVTIDMRPAVRGIPKYLLIHGLVPYLLIGLRYGFVGTYL